jgi:hypothetical protein
VSTEDDGPAEVEAAADPDRTRSAAPASFAPVANLAVEWTPIRDPRRYEILGEHGRGALGRVSRAYDKDLGRDIAVKELLSRGEIHERRFAREAMITARLEHPGIVPLYEAGKWPDGTPFYAMKLVAGRSLRELLAERTEVADRIALLHHVIAVADAMAYAHGRNIIHRDLKPANVIVGDFGETVVIDWGLAKDLGEREQLARGDGAPLADDLTSLGSVIGTPAYMPPEQERGERVDQRADVFAIGAMLWELCSVKRVPPTDPALRKKMFRRARIDPDLAVIIDKALDPDPARRYPDAGALAADLRAFKSRSRIAARDYSLGAVLAHWARRHRPVALTITIAVGIALVAGAMTVQRLRSARDRADAAAVREHREADRSKLSEAALILDKDPNRAQDLLASFIQRTPQVALLTSRARRAAAVHVVPTSGMVRGASRAPGDATLHVVTGDGALTRIDPITGASTVVDRGVERAIGYRDGRVVYLRSAASERTADREAIDARPYGSSPGLVVLRDAVYVLERSGVLHRLRGGTDEVIRRDVGAIAGDLRTLMICRTTGALEVERDGAVILRDRCGEHGSAGAMAVAGDDYALVTPDGTLIAARGDTLVRVATPIRHEYELAIGRSAIALADYGLQGKTWWLRDGGTALETGPGRDRQPWEVAADGDLLAWGYTDGSATVLDVATGIRRELHGHSAAAAYLVLDAARARAYSTNPREVRIWDLATAPSTRVATLPCTSYHLQPSPDGREVALDCDDRSVRVWTRGTDTARVIQRHGGWPWDPRWWGGRVCSGCLSGGNAICSVICSESDGSDPVALAPGARGIRVTASARDGALWFGDEGGSVSRFASPPEPLYAHGGPVYQIAASDNGRWLASCARDESIVVFDRLERRVVVRMASRLGAFCGLGWIGDELWSSGEDGALRRWTVDDGTLHPTHVVQTTGALSLVKLTDRGWAAVEAGRRVIASLDGRTVALRIDTGELVTALDLSPDGRYLAAGVATELIVIDLERHAIASSPIGLAVSALRFLEPGVLVYSETGALATLDVDQLAYEPFELVPEPASAASF